jgi:hypothetical protein
MSMNRPAAVMDARILAERSGLREARPILVRRKACLPRTANEQINPPSARHRRIVA